MHLGGAKELKGCLRLQVQQDDTFASFHHDEGEVSWVEIGERLDVVAASVVTDDFLKLLDVLSSSIHCIVASLVIVSGDEAVFGDFSTGESLPIVEEGQWRTSTASWSHSQRLKRLRSLVELNEAHAGGGSNYIVIPRRLTYRVERFDLHC